MKVLEEKTQKEHILICLSSSPSNPKVIKAGFEMAKIYNAELTAIYIETNKLLNNENQKRLEDNLIYAKNLGAKIVTLNGNNVSNQVANYAKSKNVTKLIIGRSGYKQNKIFTPPSFTDKLISLIPEIEVFIIPDKKQKLYINEKKQNTIDIPKFTLKDTFVSIFTLVFATILGGIFRHFEIYDANIVLVYILAILFIAYKTKNTLYSVLSSCVCVFLYNFFFVEPYFSTLFNNKNYALTFFTMLIVALISSSMTKKVQEQAHEAILKTYRTESLFDLSQKLAQCSSEKEINKALIEQLKKLLECELILEKEYTKEKNCLYYPIQNSTKVFGIIKINKKNISKFEKNLIQAMTRETVLALEKNIVHKMNDELLKKNQQEELRTTLLRTISHDLRTPLTSISGYMELLVKNSDKFTEEKKKNIYNDIYDDSIWLLNLVENLLSITRFGKDKIEIKQEIEFVPDIITEAISHLGRKKENYTIKTIFEEEELYAQMDSKLITQVVFNLVDNAMKYSKEHSTIQIEVKKIEKDIEISVKDEGVGISKENKEKIFDLFYTENSISADSRRGMGLGLALCKTVIEAHKSKLEIKDNTPCGTIISFKLKGYEDE